MAYQCINLTREASVATLTLNQPETLNALSAPLLKETRAALDSLATDDTVRAIIVTGNGRAFCSGANLSEHENIAEVDLGRLLQELYTPLILRMRQLEKPIICAVNGLAVGAGMSLALAGDLVLAGKSAQFIPIFSKIGLVPDAGGTFFMPRRIGSTRALEIALLGDPVPADKAVDWGLIGRCVEDDALMAEANKLATRLAAQPTVALGLTKRAIQAALNNSLEEQLDLESSLQRIAGKTEDFVEGVAAFLEKRAPEFKGH